MKKIKLSIVLPLGLALFAMFFGAGNLILPPFIGMQVTDKWLYALIGFTLTGIIAPFLGVWVVAKNGIDFTDLGKHTHPNIVWTLAAAIIWCIGPLVAIPRTGATTYEIAIKPFAPEISPTIGAIIFFVITFLLSLSPSRIVDIIGKILTPVLVILLLILIFLGITTDYSNSISSIITPIQSFQYSFIEGYQTLDVIASVVFAGIIISSLVHKGYTSINEREKSVFYAGIIAIVCLFLIYGGLIYIGSHYQIEDITRTELLMKISYDILGTYGSYAISIAIALACFTTAIALTDAFATFMTRLTNNKIPRIFYLTVCCLISTYFAIMGVDNIITYAGGLLLFVYPIAFVMILTILFFGRFIKSKIPYNTAIIVCGLLSLWNLINSFLDENHLLVSSKNYLPLNDLQLEWILPSFLAFGIGVLLDKKL